MIPSETISGPIFIIDTSAESLQHPQEMKVSADSIHIRGADTTFWRYPVSADSTWQVSGIRRQRISSIRKVSKYPCVTRVAIAVPMSASPCPQQMAQLPNCGGASAYAGVRWTLGRVSVVGSGSCHTYDNV